MYSQKKIVFRADGNSITGLGHLYRLFALIEIYKPYFDFELVTKKSSTIAIIPKDYKVSYIPESVTVEQESDWLSKHYKPSKYIIIADGYQFSSNYQKQIKEIGYILIYIDDLIQYNMYADVVVNHSPNVNPREYNNFGHTRFALGTEYAILRPSFINASKKTPKEPTNPNVAFICFGGADPYNLSLKAAKGLINIKQIEFIHVVIGAANKHKDLTYLAKANKRIILHQNLEEKKMLELMEKCNFAIAPSSTILYELCSVKMPILSGFYTKNQEKIYYNLFEEGAIFGGGRFLNV